jgi:hypothetical protein
MYVFKQKSQGYSAYPIELKACRNEEEGEILSCALDNEILKHFHPSICAPS